MDEEKKKLKRKIAILQRRCESKKTIQIDLADYSIQPSPRSNFYFTPTYFKPSMYAKERDLRDKKSTEKKVRLERRKKKSSFQKCKIHLPERIKKLRIVKDN